ncbi:MAG: cupin-like domain-containing protein [Cyclobacteriaceae bacterium]
MDLLNQVENYDPALPKGKFGFLSLRWSLLFMVDYAFSLSKQQDKDGNLIKRYESQGYPGKSFRKIHESMVNRLKNQRSAPYHNTLPLPSIDSSYVDRKFFTHWHKKANMPLVIKGYIKGQKVMEATTIASLVEQHGQKEVKFIERESTKKDAYRVGQNTKVSTATLEEYLTKEEYRENYINNFYGILDDNDYLEKSRGVDIDEFRGQKSFVSQWFISRKKNSGSTLHCAIGDNMFLNIHGNKEWFFIDPSFMPLLKPALSKYGVYSVAELNEEVNINANFYDEITTDYPYLKHIPIYRCMLAPGDVLYNPSAWWHSVRNHSDYTVGCAVRYPSKQLDNNSITLSICCLLIEAFKHPKKSLLPQIIKMASGNTSSKKDLINSIFSGGKKRIKKA